MATNGTASATSTSLVDLAQGILAKTQQISAYLETHGIPEPTFAANSSVPPSDAEYRVLTDGLRTSLEDLQKLVDGPPKFFRHFLMRAYEVSAFQVALDFDFFNLVPAEGDIALHELAAKAGLDLDRTSRIVRFLITYRFFQERTPGRIAHNALSYALRDDELRAMVHYTFDEMVKAGVESSTALKATPQESDSVHCPFFVRHGVSIFKYYGKHPEHAGRFARAMAGWRKMENSITELRDNFPWADLKGTVVDIGGGSGHVSIILAKLFPQLNFVVQDETQDMLAPGLKLLTDDVRSRISFETASFFEPQPRTNAAAFLLRQCTHNWADADVVTMFRAVVPGLEKSAPGTPLLVNDIILPEPGSIAVAREREMRQADMVMLVSFGAKQRTVAEFDDLLKKADARYEIRKVHDQGALGVLEVILNK